MLKKYNIVIEDVMVKDGIVGFMAENGIKYEVSAYYDGYYLALYCSKEDASKINVELDKLYNGNK